MSFRTINISLPADLVKRIDKSAAENFASRSEYIRYAILEKLRADEAATTAAVKKAIAAAKRKEMKKFVTDQSPYADDIR